ncbi:hypothetical protein ABEF95_008708 [Exophiala dermatitidis]
MPFFIDTEEYPRHSAKRRKLSTLPGMARYSVHTFHETGESRGGSEEDVGICEESRTEHCSDEGAVPLRTSDREELIQCIKRGQRPTWVPKPGFEALRAAEDAQHVSPAVTDPRPGASAQSAPVEGNQTQRRCPTTDETNGMPATASRHHSPSAFHTGDFNHFTSHVSSKWNSSVPTSARRSFGAAYSVSPPPWQSDHQILVSPLAATSPPLDTWKRNRAPSIGSSLSSSFVMRVPTSPLVHAINNTSLDTSARDVRSDDDNTISTGRRRTMPPSAFASLQFSPPDDHHRKHNWSSPCASDHPATLPQCHRTRRSLSSFTYQPVASPNYSAKLRRPSLASDVSPRQRASMVGSFEESILRGRMSTPPSKPFDFVAQIGVVGKGNCPSSLKCPAHVTVPFPAVFYSYPSATTSRSISDDNPSPYVGVIDLQRNLPPLEHGSRRIRRSDSSLDPEALAAEITSPENTPIGRALAREAEQKKPKEKKPASHKSPPGGAYRVPQKGQLQIIIKNPNKTAVKLFLVPYDLEGMPIGTKTFVRQRSFSSGPILEATVSEQQANLAARDPLSQKDILRYLIHIKFCCTSKGRFYLYDNIRVVFANRVPDGKEKLRNEVQLPEPRFSPYKPPVESGSQSPSLAKGDCPQAGASPSPQFGEFDGSYGLGIGHLQASRAQHPKSIPFHILPRTIEPCLNKSQDEAQAEQTASSEAKRHASPIPGFRPSTSSRSSPVPWPSSSGSTMVRSFSPAAVEAGDGLISRQLRELNGGNSDQIT